jgi:uncharacterized membrane protein YgcG
LTEEDQQDDGNARRRAALAGALLTGVAVLILLLLGTGAGAELELDGANTWINSGSNTVFERNSTGGTVTFGDPSEPLTVRWSDFEPGETEIEFVVTGKGLSSGENAGTWSNGDTETETAVLAKGNYTVEGTDGRTELTWGEIFGESRPVSITDHPQISRNDFETTTGVRSRSFGIGVRATAPEQDATAESFRRALANMVGAAVGGGPTERVTEPPTDYGVAQTAIVVRTRPSGTGGVDNGESNVDGGNREQSGRTSEEFSSTPGGFSRGGGGAVVRPVPAPEDPEGGLSGLGSFELESRHEVGDDE